MDNKLLDASQSKAFLSGGTPRLRLFFLLPLIITILFIISTLSLLLYNHINNEINDGSVHINASLEDLYNESIRYDIQALQTIMSTLDEDEKLADALAQRNRELLLHRASPLFENMKRNFNITHFYFTGTDRVNILRVHTPLRYGDVIERDTMYQAYHNGLPAYGVELGPLGTLTLRFVAPWYDKKTRKRIGYVELGMEIDHVIDKLRHFFNVEVFTLVNKEFLDRTKWESGMHALGFTHDWDRFLNVVESQHSTNMIPSLLAEHLVDGKEIKNNSILYASNQNFTYRVSTLPLYDVSTRSIAQVILLSDISEEVNEANEIIYMGSSAVFGMGATLFLFFYWLVGRIGKSIEKDEQKLHDLATHDSLTGLYNHMFFYKKLHEELERAHRFEHSLSLLILDIDHFKDVNDTHGHQVGDAVLRSLSDLLKDNLRSIDWICRYGGEEIALILIETDMLRAKEIAEKLRSLVENKPFDIGNDQHTNITVSIGTATYPRDAQEIPLLVSAADTALYQAKEDGRNRVCVHQFMKNL